MGVRRVESRCSIVSRRISGTVLENVRYDLKLDARLWKCFLVGVRFKLTVRIDIHGRWIFLNFCSITSM
jgi:hypothetical protein